MKRYLSFILICTIIYPPVSAFSAKDIRIEQLNYSFNQDLDPGLWALVMDNTGALGGNATGRSEVIFSIEISNFSNTGLKYTIFQGNGVVEGGKYFVINFKVAVNRGLFKRYNDSGTLVQISSYSSSPITFILLSEAQFGKYQKEMQNRLPPPRPVPFFTWTLVAALTPLTLLKKKRYSTYDGGI